MDPTVSMGEYHAGEYHASITHHALTNKSGTQLEHIDHIAQLENSQSQPKA